MTDKNGKERKPSGPPANPVRWVSELDPDMLQGILFGLAKRYDADHEKRDDIVKVRLPGALVRMVENFTLFLAKTVHPGMGDPVEFILQSVLISQAMTLTRQRQGNGDADLHSVARSIVSMVDGVAKAVAERGKDVGPEEFVGLLRNTLQKIGFGPDRVAVYTEAEAEAALVDRAPDKATDKEEADMPVVPPDRPGAS